MPRCSHPPLRSFMWGLNIFIFVLKLIIIVTIAIIIIISVMYVCV